MQHIVTSEESALDGLWVLLVQDDSGRVPMLARAGNQQTYLLGFRNVGSAQRFIKSSSIQGAEPRMVVRGNRNEMLSAARSNGAIGVLVDYDPTTHRYATATELY